MCVIFSRESLNFQIVGGGSLLGLHHGSIMCLLVIAFWFALGLHLGCVGVLSWWSVSVGCVIRFHHALCLALHCWDPQTPNLGVGLSVVALMVVVLFVVV